MIEPYDLGNIHRGEVSYFGLGFLAAIKGQDRSSCPHRDNEKRTLWLAGYDYDCRKEEDNGCRSK